MQVISYDVNGNINSYHRDTYTGIYLKSTLYAR